MDNSLTGGEAAREEEEFPDPQHAKETAKQERTSFRNDFGIPLNIGILEERSMYAENLQNEIKSQGNFQSARW